MDHLKEVLIDSIKLLWVVKKKDFIRHYKHNHYFLFIDEGVCRSTISTMTSDLPTLPGNMSPLLLTLSAAATGLNWTELKQVGYIKLLSPIDTENSPKNTHYIKNNT